MGYFTAGVLLTSQPQWDRLNDLPSPLGFRGYAHSSESVWLCDFWCGQPLPNYPFQDGFGLMEQFLGSNAFLTIPAGFGLINA